MTRFTRPSELVSKTNCVTEDVIHNLDGFDTADRGRFINTGSSVISNITGTQNTQLLASLASMEQVFLDRNALSESFGAQWNEVVSLYMADETGLKLLLGKL